VASVLDLGTGSGAIAVSIALERPEATVVAADFSIEAIAIAAKNARRLNANVEFVESNWYASLAGRKFDVIVANPPYVAGGDAHLSQGDLRFEPQIALTDDSGDGLHSIRAIVDGAADHLHAGGWLLFEHGYDQAEACRALLLKAGFKNLISINDLAGISRVAGGQIG
jgi:release factor glutamine methyltransferase